MIVAIHQPHYLPWLRYFHKIASCDVFVLLDDAQFTKNGWQNRNKIKGPQGPVMLTVPVVDASFKPINCVDIHQRIPWREKHWKSLQNCYVRAGFFGRYAEIFERTYSQRWTMLSHLNCQMIMDLCAALGITTPLLLSSSLNVPGRGTPRLIEICHSLGGTKYLTGAYAAGNHLDILSFAQAGLEVVVQDWACPTYRQLFPGIGFLPELSVVDLLFNEGPDSLRILHSRPELSDQDLAPALTCRPPQRRAFTAGQTGDAGVPAQPTAIIE